MKKISQFIAKIKIIVKRSPVEVSTLAGLVVLTLAFTLPSAARAMALPGKSDQMAALEVAAMQNATRPFGILPTPGLRAPSYTMKVIATAYNSLPNQTDDTPFITASGTHVRMGVIAANFLPMGTKVKIPDYYGDQVFVVEDRMNQRYDKRIDIWMDGIDGARMWRVRTVAIEVYRGK